MFKLLVLVTLCGFAAAAKLDEVFTWKEVQFAWPNEETKQNAVKSGDYIPANNLPLGLGRWRDKLFVTVPRWKAGVPASLNYIPLYTNEKSPALIPYPDLKANTLPKNNEKLEENHIISTFRIHIDQCDRLWVMDTGIADILGAPKQYSKPSLVVFDLNTDKLIRRYELKPTDLKEDSFFPNVIVDVLPGKCDESFSYIPDLGGYGIVVYSWKANDSWRVKHNFFHFDPLNGDFNIAGVNFQWPDGVFGLALSKIQANGFRILYFHAVSSTREFSVSTEVLRNQTLATDPLSYNLFKYEGDKGPRSQTSASVVDEQTDVLFLSQINKDTLGCWNTKKPLTPENVGIVAQDREKLIFTNDITIDTERNLWVLSDRMPLFLYRTLNPNEYNYRIMKVKVDDAIASTCCTNYFY